MRSDLRDKRWTVGILFSGGLLDTFAAVRSGFTPIWDCETNSILKRAYGRGLRILQIVVTYSDRECVKWLKGQCILNLEHLARTIAEAVASSGHTVKLDGAS